MAETIGASAGRPRRVLPFTYLSMYYTLNNQKNQYDKHCLSVCRVHPTRRNPVSRTHAVTSHALVYLEVTMSSGTWKGYLIRALAQGDLCFGLCT